jgi:hypothetical protein
MVKKFKRDQEKDSMPTYFKNIGGPQIVTLHGLVKAGEVMATDNPIVAKGLRSHSRYQEVSKSEYERYRNNPQFRTGEEP